MRGGPAGGRGMMRGMPRGNLRGRARGGVMRGALSMRGVLFFLSFFLTSPNMLKTTPSSSLLSNMRSCQPLFDTGVSYGNAYIDRSYILQVIVAFSWRELLRQSSLTIINTTLLSLIGKRLSTGVPMRGRGSAGRLSMRRGGRNRGGGAGRGGPMSRGAPRGVARGQNWLHYWPGHSKLLFFLLTSQLISSISSQAAVDCAGVAASPVAVDEDGGGAQAGQPWHVNNWTTSWMPTCQRPRVTWTQNWMPTWPRQTQIVWSDLWRTLAWHYRSVECNMHITVWICWEVIKTKCGDCPVLGRKSESAHFTSPFCINLLLYSFYSVSVDLDRC